MTETDRGIIGPYPPIWKMQATDIQNIKKIPDKDKIMKYEEIITLFSNYHVASDIKRAEIDTLRENLANAIEEIINSLKS